MKSKILLALVLAAALLTFFAPALAEVPSPMGDFYVLDQADVLSDETEGNIILNNDKLAEACGAQIVVVTVPTTGATEIADYAYKLFNTWGIGSAKENNGLLVLLVIDDDNYYVLQGKGLRTAFSSSTLANLNNTWLEPDFARKDYDAGIRALFPKLYNRLSALYTTGLTYDDTLYDSYVASIREQVPSSEKSMVADAFVECLLITSMLVLYFGMN